MRTFEVRARPMTKVDGLRPGMSVLVQSSRLCALPIAWLNAVTRTTFREIKCLVKNPGEVLVTFVFPLVWMLVVWGLLGKGVIEQVPVAMVDNDNTRRITPSCPLELSSIRAIKPVVINTQAEALEELEKRTVYGIISIPFGYIERYSFRPRILNLRLFGRKSICRSRRYSR